MGEVEFHQKLYFLDGTYYITWMCRLNVVLIQRDLLKCCGNTVQGILDSQRKSKPLENKAKELGRKKYVGNFIKLEKKPWVIIISRIFDNHLAYEMDLSTLKKILRKFELVFQRQSIASQLFLKKTFCK